MPFRPKPSKPPSKLLTGSKNGLGAYSESKGLRYIRDAVAAFITRRDGIKADPESIYLTDGASKGVQAALRLLLAEPSDGIMIPIPQYPLYSATITMYQGTRSATTSTRTTTGRFPASCSRTRLAKAEPRPASRPKAIVVINPGNPTGSVLTPTT